VSTASPNVAVPRSGVLGLIERVIGWLEAVPYSLLAIPARLAVAEVFWSSFSTKIQNWDTTVTLFEDEYKLPLELDMRALFASSRNES
jgi:putative oxidoreductase